MPPPFPERERARLWRSFWRLFVVAAVQGGSAGLAGLGTGFSIFIGIHRGWGELLLERNKPRNGSVL